MGPMETVTWKHVHYCATQIASVNVRNNSGHSTRALTTWKSGIGWQAERKFRREETRVYLWLTHVDVWQRPTQYCGAGIPQLKINF